MDLLWADLFKYYDWPKLSKMTLQIHQGRLVINTDKLQIEQEYLEYSGGEGFLINLHQPNQPKWLNQSASSNNYSLRRYWSIEILMDMSTSVLWCHGWNGCLVTRSCWLSRYLRRFFFKHSNLFDISSHQIIEWEWLGLQLHWIYQLSIAAWKQQYSFIKSKCAFGFFFQRTVTNNARHRTILSEVTEPSGPRVLMATHWSVEGPEMALTRLRRGASRWSTASGRTSSTWWRSEPMPRLWLWGTRFAFDRLFFYLSDKIINSRSLKALCGRYPYSPIYKFNFSNIKNTFLEFRYTKQ